GYPLQTPEQLAQQKRTWNSEPRYYTEDEQASYFRESGVRAILDLGFDKHLVGEEARAIHDYAFEYQRRHSDCVLGNWIHVDPTAGRLALEEFERCVRAGAGFCGLAVSGSGSVAASDPAWEPFYRVCIEARVPALIFVGTTGAGAGLPGGGGIRLDTTHPRHLDEVAAAHPALTIVAARPAWPWQDEMIAIMIHKPNVWYELHGWSPKYHTPALKHEIARRLKDRVMFGADFPLFRYERLVEDWTKEGYSEDILERVFHRNAERFFSEVIPTIGVHA
ncbi:MAG: amidohydrolase family protein, partial [Candidatus Eremiobacteraeota bacterium]|nr:amidohydrolase family protein [Candidatus Eremiobacteraeota bacterium]